MGRPSLIFASLRRLDALMATGQSRHAAKQQIRAEAAARGETPAWTLSTGRMHSYKTRDNYQEHVLHFVTWARDQQRIRTLADLDARADELACTYLNARLADGKSPSTLQSERSALRMFFSDRALGTTVVIPPRRREDITQNRGTPKSATHFQPAHHQEIIRFCEATGLRRCELGRLLVKDIQIHEGEDLQIHVHVHRGKGGRSREVQVRAGYERDVLALVQGRDPEANVFAHVPDRLRVHVERRASAQGRYQDIAQRDLPPAQGRLSPTSYDKDAAHEVSESLGHNRIDIVTRHYIR